jgi:hypothetical protein
MEDQEQENKMDVISVDVPLFIRLLEFAREDATDDMKLHDVAEKLIELCADGDIMQMEQYDEIVGTKVDGADTSGMNAVEDNMHPQNKNMNEINEQRWMKLAGIITEEYASKFKVGDIVLIQVNGQSETTPREIQSINGKFYGVSGTNKRPDGKGYSSEGGKEVAEDDIKLASGVTENKSTEAAAWLVDEENGLPKIIRFASVKQAKNNQIDDMADNPRKRSLFTSLASLADYLEKAYDITNVESYRYIK